MLLAPGAPDDMQVGIFARLKEGVTTTQAQAELRDLYRAIHRSGETREFQPVVYDLQGEFTFLAGRTLRRTLMVAFGAVLLVLLIACLNVANLMVARLSERRRELAVRAALGSGQGRLLRQVLTESLLLASVGSVLGLAIAWSGLAYFRYANPIELRVGAELQLNMAVLGFSAALSLVATLLTGMMPALRASRVDPATNLMSAGRGTVAGGQALARSVIVVETALSFLLLIGAGLLMASALRMGSTPLGFSPRGLLAMRISLPAASYGTDARRLQTYDELGQRLERLPGVHGVALASKLPPQAGGNQTLEIQGRAVAPGSEIHNIGADAVSPQFFDLLHIPLRRGRLFGVQDSAHSQPVVLINEALARAYFPESDPLGGQIRIPGANMPWLTIVGVVGDLKHTQLMNEMTWVETPILYRPLAQEPRPGMQIAIRVAPGAITPPIRDQILALDPAIPISDPEPLEAALSKTLAYPRFRAAILGLFASFALLLSTVGLHGVLSQLVSQRTAEFGLRRAVGAQTYQLMMLVARQGGVPVVAGLATGLVATLELRRVLANLLYGIEPADPVVLATVSALLLAVAGLAIVLPARRAARVDPMVALREG
jgi:putative ABC transport system permease protein